MNGVIAWGSFILVPHPMRLEDSPVRPGIPDEPNLQGRDFATDIAVIRDQSLDAVPAAVRQDVRVPTWLPYDDLGLTGAWWLPSERGSLHTSILFWHRNSNASPRVSADARSAFDLWVARGKVAPPVLVGWKQPPEPDAAIVQWEITPIEWDGIHGLFHHYVPHPDIDPIVQRDWLQADGLEWIDEDSFVNVVMAWQADLEGLLRIARSLR